MNAPVTGKTLAHLVSEELSQINDTNQRGDPFASKLTHYADTGALQTEALAIPAIGGVSVWGFSPDNLAAAWQFLRTDEQSISAELIGPVAGRFRLHASVSSSRAHGSWDQPITGIGDLAIQQACLELAHRILSELSPQAMGRYYLLTGQPILALAELHRWRLLQPRDPEPLFYIGWAYDRQADITADSTKPEDTAESVSFRKMATDSYHAALKIDPKHAESINALGLEAEIGGNNQLACNYYAAADTSKPNDPTFLANLGNCKMGQKRFSEAFRYYERALKRDPKFAGGWWNYGLALEEVPDGEAAACDGLAACLRADKVQNCKRRESQRAYETAVSLRGDFTEALIDLARVLRYDNQPAPAAATVSEAIRLLEKDVSYPNKHAKTRARAYETRCLAEEDERFLDQALTDCGLA
ncbi:MAG: tetratricopeptide repeat protein, partial [Terriglobales bacterium]